MAVAEMRSLLARPIPKLYAADTFGRADSNTSLGTADLGGAWTVAGAGGAACVYGLNGGTAYCVSTSASDALAYLDTGTSDRFRLSLDCVPISGGFIGATLRFVDTSNYLGARLQQAGSNVQIVRNLAGSRTVLFVATRTLTAGVPVHLDVDVAGTQITISVNGVPFVSGADGNFTTSTKHGLWAGSTVGTSAWLDNFQVRERAV